MKNSSRQQRSIQAAVQHIRLFCNPTIFRSLRLLVSAGAIVLLLAWMDLSSLSEILASANGLYFAAGIALVLLGVAVSAWRWQILVTTQGVKERYSTLAYIYMVGIFFNNLLPTSIGGDIVRTGYLGRHQPHWAGIAFSILAERVLGLIALFFLGSLAVTYLVVTGGHSDALRIAGPPVIGALVIAASVGILFLSPYPSIVTSLRSGVLERPLLHRLFKGTPYVQAAVNRVGPALWPALVLSLLFQAIVLVSSYVAALTVGVTPPIVLFPLFVPLIVLATLIPISINGLGIREGLTVILWTQVGLSEETAFAMAIMSYIFVLSVGILGGLAFAIRR